MALFGRVRGPLPGLTNELSSIILSFRIIANNLRKPGPAVGFSALCCGMVVSPAPFEEQLLNNGDCATSNYINIPLSQRK